jgi:hypothetical protein
MRRVLAGAVVALVAFFVLTGAGAVIATAGTGTLDGRATAWVLVCFAAALIAGFAGCRVAVGAARARRFAAALVGPLAISLAYTLTTDARDRGGLWVAFAATALGALCGAASRDAVGRAQRRRL